MSTLWRPFPNSPQEQAYNSKAHEVFFGYGAGGGKTALCVGLAVTKHKNSLLLRRSPIHCEGLIYQLKRVVGKNGQWRGFRYNGCMKMANGRSITIGSCESEDDKNKYAEMIFDFIAFDEVAEFSQTQVNFFCNLNQSKNKKQRCRILMTGNPPLPAKEHWLIRRFAPWLAMDWAKPGTILHEKTVILGTFRDNPFLAASGYGDAISSLAEPIRSSLLCENFTPCRKNLTKEPSSWIWKSKQHFGRHGT